MTIHYDHIATEYQIILSMPIFEMIGHTLTRHLGDIQGQSVLDLACGEGFHTRRVKRLGAGRTVGVDLSAAMLNLARQRETQDPLGIEYRHSAVQDLGQIGQFDWVIAIFLLHYASTPAELAAMCQTVYNNLKPGGHFIAMINPGRGIDRLAAMYDRYGYLQRVVSPPLREGGKIEITLTAETAEIQFEIHYYTQATYETALRQAGFTNIAWQPMTLPPSLEPGADWPFWEIFLDLDTSPIALIKCQK